MSYEHRQALSAGTRLHEYELLHVLGSGGFGVVYLAHDHELEQKVIIKEYLPGAFAVRLAGNTVVPTSPKEEGNFQWGLDSFLHEARALADFRQCPNIVSVLRYFKANNTGYMVMEYAGAVSLQDFLEVHETLTEKQLLALVLPLLVALETIHAKGVIHRDIKPGNILINDDSQPVLIDFGAARQAVGERSMSLTAVLTQGFAPFEQYHKLGQQGPWTDIYALAAVMYRCVTGVTPPESTARMDAPADRLSVAEVARGDYAPHLLAAIDWGLQVRAVDRPQAIAEWRDRIETPIPVAPQPPEAGRERVLTATGSLGQWLFSTRQRLLASLLAVVLLLGIALLFMPASDGGNNLATSPVTNPVPQPIGAVTPAVEQPAATDVVSVVTVPETVPPAIEIVPEPEVMPPATEQAPPPKVVPQKTQVDGKAGNKSRQQKSGSRRKSQADKEAREQARRAEAEAIRRQAAAEAARRKAAAAAARKRQKSGDSPNPFDNGQL